MKKLLLLLSLLTISFTYAVAYVPASGNMNPFAYDLKSTYNEENMTLNFEFKVNAPAKSIRVYAKDSQDRTYLLDEQTTATDRAITYFVENLDLREKGLPVGEDFTWYVDVEGTSHSQALFVDNQNLKLYRPTSIDIDDNPENPNFGTVFCVESKNNAKGESSYSSYLSYTDGAGLYVFNADGTARPLPRVSVDGFGLSGVYDKLRYGYNGSQDMTTPVIQGGKTGFVPYRIRVSEDGRIFIASMTPNGDVLFEANSRIFNATNDKEWSGRTWTKIISSSNDGTSLLTGNAETNNTGNLYTKASGGEFIAGPNMGFDVRGSGNDLKLVMLSGSKRAIIYQAEDQFRCDEYDLGSQTKWTVSPSRAVFGGAKTITIHEGTQVQYDKDGNVWMCQFRGMAGHPTLRKYSKSGSGFNAEPSYDENPVHFYRRCGAMRFNKNFDKVIITSKGSGTGGAATLYPVGNDGNPIWNQGVEITMRDKTGPSHMDFAWDWADNLYIACDGDGGHCVAIYAMPNQGNNVVSTPAASKYKFSTKYSVAWKNLFIYGLDIADDTKNYRFPEGSNTKIDYAGTNNRLWRLLQVGYNRYCISNGKSARGDFESVSTTTAQLNVSSFFTINDGVVYDFFTKDSYFSWLGDYFSKISGVNLSTIAMCAQNADEFINRTGNFVEYGKPQYWRPMWAEAVCGLPATMDPNAYMPIKWNWTAADEQYFDTYWVNSWDTYVDPNIYGRVDYVYYSCPSQWYDFNTVRWRQDEGLSDDTHILAWRDGGVDGNIVHRVTRPNMELYATYVEKNIDENNPPANPANFDATNEDLFQLLDNRNFKPDNPSAAPTHDLTITRHLAAGMYNTICLPINIDLAGLLEARSGVEQHPLKYKADGSGATVLEFTGVTHTTNAAGEDITVLNFTQVTQMVAGKPYLVKLRDGAEDYTEKMPFTTVSVHADEYHPVEHAGITFVPTINPTTIPAGSIILVADNRLALTTEKGQMAGLRGYFTVAPAQAKEIAEQAADGRVVFSVKQSVTTSVVDIQQPEVQTVQKILQDGNIYIIRGNEKYTITGNLVR